MLIYPKIEWIFNFQHKFSKIKAKEKRFRQNRKLKKLLTPRNATVALHELFGQDGSSQISEFQVKPSGNQFQAEVVINNNRYEGLGSSKMSAKNNACEKALRDLIINKLQQKSLDKVPDAPESKWHCLLNIIFDDIDYYYRWC